MTVYEYEFVRDEVGYIVSEGNWTVNEVFAEEGDEISEGDLLFSIDTDKYRADLLRIQAEATAYDNSLKAPGLSEEDRSVIQLRSYAAWREYRLLRDSFPSSGEVVSAVSGTVLSVDFGKHDTLRAGQKLIEIAGGESKIALKIELSATENSVYSDLDSVKLYYLHSGSSKTAKAEIISKEKHDNVYNWYVEIPEEMTEYSVIQYVELEKRSADYESIIPTACIQYNLETGDYVYFVTEERKGQSVVNVIQMLNITVLERGELYSAVQFYIPPRGKGVVIFSTKPIAFGSEVIIL